MSYFTSFFLSILILANLVSCSKEGSESSLQKTKTLDLQAVNKFSIEGLRYMFDFYEARGEAKVFFKKYKKHPYIPTLKAVYKINSGQPEEGLKELNELIKKDDPYALREKGIILMTNEKFHFLNKDLYKAYLYFQKSKELGLEVSENNISVLKINRLIPYSSRQSAQEGVKSMESRANKGDSQAAHVLTQVFKIEKANPGLNLMPSYSFSDILPYHKQIALSLQKESLESVAEIARATVSEELTLNEKEQADKTLLEIEKALVEKRDSASDETLRDIYELHLFQLKASKGDVLDIKEIERLTSLKDPVGDMIFSVVYALEYQKSLSGQESTLPQDKLLKILEKFEGSLKDKKDLSILSGSQVFDFFSLVYNTGFIVETNVEKAKKYIFETFKAESAVEISQQTGEMNVDMSSLAHVRDFLTETQDRLDMYKKFSDFSKKKVKTEKSAYIEAQYEYLVAYANVLILTEMPPDSQILQKLNMSEEQIKKDILDYTVSSAKKLYPAAVAAVTQRALLQATEIDEDSYNKILEEMRLAVFEKYIQEAKADNDSYSESLIAFRTGENILTGNKNVKDLESALEYFEKASQDGACILLLSYLLSYKDVLVESYPDYEKRINSIMDQAVKTAERLNMELPDYLIPQK